MQQSSTTSQAAADLERIFGASFDDNVEGWAEQWRSAAGQLAHFGREWVLDGYMTHNIDNLVSMVTDDFSQEDPLNFGREVHGPTEFRRVLEETFLAFPDCTFAIDGAPLLGMDPGTFVVQWRSWGTFAGPLAWGPPGSGRVFQPTGRTFDFRGVDIYTMRGDKVSSLRSLYDPIEVAQQIGLMPSLHIGPMRLVQWPQALLARVQRLTAR